MDKFNVAHKNLIGLASMWLNMEHTSDASVAKYQSILSNTYPKHVVIDNFLNESKLSKVLKVLEQPQQWKTQRHAYSALYVDHTQWSETIDEQKFVKRDAWIRNKTLTSYDQSQIAHNLLAYLREQEFMLFLSRIFKVSLTDKNVKSPKTNTNYYRLNHSDFVQQHADDSPGREVCMLLYLNKNWNIEKGGELTFAGRENNPINIAPIFNRCVLFDPSSLGSEHWVNPVSTMNELKYRYNITSWYWSE